MPETIQAHVRNGGNLYLIAKQVNHRALISVDSDFTHQYCIAINTYDIDTEL